MLLKMSETEICSSISLYYPWIYLLSGASNSERTLEDVCDILNLVSPAHPFFDALLIL